MCVCDALGGRWKRRVGVEGSLFMSIMLSSVLMLGLSCIVEEESEVCEDSGV